MLLWTIVDKKYCKPDQKLNPPNVCQKELQMTQCYRNLPKALTISFSVVITLSEAVVGVYFLVLSPYDVLSADAVAVVS